jgi:hypothetical protein
MANDANRDYLGKALDIAIRLASRRRIGTRPGPIASGD